MTDGKERALDNGNSIQRRNHANEFMRPNADGSIPIDLEKLNIDLSEYGIDTNQPNWQRQFTADVFDKLPNEQQQAIREALTNHIVETLNDPKTRFSIANEDGTKFYFHNSETRTNIIYDANHPEGGTMIRNSSKPSKADSLVRNQNSKIPPEVHAKFETPTLRGEPMGIEGGLNGALNHYEEVTGKPPHITGPIEGYDGNDNAGSLREPPPNNDSASLLNTSIDEGTTPNSPSKPNIDVPSTTARLLDGVGRLGVVAGVGVAAVHLARGEVAEAAEAVVPGAASVNAAREGRPTEAFLSACEETGVGVLATELARPALRLAGVDVDSGIIEGALQNAPPLENAGEPGYSQRDGQGLISKGINIPTIGVEFQGAAGDCSPPKQPTITADKGTIFSEKVAVKQHPNGEERPAPAAITDNFEFQAAANDPNIDDPNGLSPEVLTKLNNILTDASPFKI